MTAAFQNYKIFSGRVVQPDKESKTQRSESFFVCDCSSREHINIQFYCDARGIKNYHACTSLMRYARGTNNLFRSRIPNNNNAQ